MELYELRDSVLRVSYEIYSLKTLISKLEVIKDNLEGQKVKLLEQIDELIEVEIELDILGGK